VSTPVPPFRLGPIVRVLILTAAAIGFLFDTYELLMFPIIGSDSVGELIWVKPDNTSAGTLADLGLTDHADLKRGAPPTSPPVRMWGGRMLWVSALCGGIFGLLGGFLVDRLGRKKVMVGSIIIYSFSPVAAAYSTELWQLVLFRCTTFIGVCVEFVAAVAWLSELFPDPKQREAVLGYTQAFSSIGGLLVTGAFLYFVNNAKYFPEWAPFHGPAAFWRYTLASGLIPAIPLILIRPFLPESPAWRDKKAAGTLKRPSFGQLFEPRFRRTTLVAALMFACSYGAAFGAIQLTPQIVPGLVPGLSELVKLRKQLDAAEEGSEQYDTLMEKIKPLTEKQQTVVGNVQMYQEIGGLVGRFALAWLAIRILGRRKLLRIFQLPGLVLIPLVFALPAAGNLGGSSLEVLRWGMFIAGFFTVAQFSFWGNYLPRVYPTYLRGTGESFAANVGGRMVGTAANPLATYLAPALLASMPGITRPSSIAYAAAVVALVVYAVGSIACFWLPEPQQEELPD
jgi:MFS family permease